MPDIRERKVGTLTYGDSAVLKLELPRQHVIRRIGINFEGTFTVSGGASDGTIVEDGILNLLSRIELKANGSDTLKSVSARLLHFKSHLEDGSQDVIVQPAVTVGANTFKAQLYLDLLLKNTVQDETALLDSRRLTGLDLFVTTANSVTGVTSGGDRVEVATGTITITLEEMVGVVGNFHANIEQLFELDLTGQAASTERRIKLTRGDVYKTLAILVRDNAVRDNSLVTNVKLKVDGVNVLVDIPWNDLQNGNVRFYGVERSSGSPPITGFGIIEFDREHLLQSLVDTLNTAEFELEFNHGSPTSTADITVLAQTLRINPKAGVGAQGKGQGKAVGARR